jgi:anti-sigma factor RsiW
MRLFSRKPMICREAVEAVTAYLEDAMPARERARFEAHLAGCPHCTAYLAQIRLTIAVTGAIAPAELSPEAQRALQDVFEGWAAGR